MLKSASKFILPSLFAFYFIERKCYSLGIVKGSSMSPTLNPSSSSDWVILNKMNTFFERGDIIFFTDPENSKQTLVKRIVAVQGDFARRHSPNALDLLFIPDLIYNYSKNIMQQNFTGDHWIIIPEGHVWVESDSLESHQVRDSRKFGPIPLGLVIGKVEGIVWPLERLGSSIENSNPKIVVEGRLISRSDDGNNHIKNI